MRSHLEFLASDALGGRGSGTRDEWIAATYAAAHMRRIGVEPAGQGGDYLQTIPIERTDAASPPVLSVAGKRFTHGEHLIVLSIRSAQVTGPLHKHDGAGIVPDGAVVLMPKEGSVAASSVQKAAVQLLPETAQVRSRWTAAAARLPGLPAQIAGVPATTTRPAAVYVDNSTYDAIATIPNGTPVSLTVDLKPPATTRTWNAVGRLAGSDEKLKGEVILLSAHLDHLGTRPSSSGAEGADSIYNGADDDATGTVAVLELAEALAAGPAPKRTIVFALFGSEESGGYGSRFFAERPPAPLASIVANLQFEMIGRPDKAVPAQTLWLTGYERSTLGPTLAKHGARLVKDPHLEQNFFMRSDNYQFARRGIVAHTVSSYGLHTDYHQPSDEVRADWDLSGAVEDVQLCFFLGAHVARQPQLPTWRPGDEFEGARLRALEALRAR